MKKRVLSICILASLLLLGACQKVSDTSKRVEEVIYPNYSLNYNDDGTFKEVDSSKLVVLPEDLQNIICEESEVTVSQTEIDQAINSILSEFATQQLVTTRAVEQGDTVYIDYEGLVDGKAFGGSDTNGEGIEFSWGYDSMRDEFMNQLIGVMPGEIVTISVEFPTPYSYNETLSGKTAIFTVTLHHIIETHLPELTDEFVVTNINNYTSVDHLINQLQEELQEEKLNNAALNWLFENATCQDIPQKLIDNEFEILEQELAYFSANSLQGISIDGVASYFYSDFGVTKFSELKDFLQEEKKDEIKQKLILQETAKVLNITVSEEDAKEYQDYIEQAGQGYVYNTILNYLVSNALVSNIVKK
ncbi:MAG: FKBP-type peptidyl-prolyl cis-trans isomerase [Lachnospiraceae bacterium]